MQKISCKLILNCTQEEKIDSVQLPLRLEKLQEVYLRESEPQFIAAHNSFDGIYQAFVSK